MKDLLQVSILGASGYSGMELVKILLNHPGVKLRKLFASNSAGKNVSELYPQFFRAVNLTYEAYSLDAACSSDLLFIALPSGEAMTLVPELLARGKKVVDLGGDFRLRSAVVYEQFYRHPHTAPDLLKEAVYGLPEWNRGRIKEAQLVANPGCYPTSALLPLLPLLKERVIEETIIISSLSGVSGAGRSSSMELSFAEVNESVKAYRVGVHQHTPEITNALELFAGHPARVTFVPHLIPITRGIYSSIYAPLRIDARLNDLEELYVRYYGEEVFVRCSSTSIPAIKNVRSTNYVDIGFHIDEENKMLILLSVIDNLVKGAAGQAVQNMNLMAGFNETEGLL